MTDKEECSQQKQVILTGSSYKPRPTIYAGDLERLPWTPFANDATRLRHLLVEHGKDGLIVCGYRYRLSGDSSRFINRWASAKGS